MPERVIETNLLGFTHVLRAARNAGVRRVINLSSTAAYGDAAFGPEWLDEADTAPDPVTLYSLTKFATERTAQRLAFLWDSDIRSIRLSGVFGRFERKTSARDTPSPMLQIVESARRREPAILARPGVRDWTYAPDVARAVAMLLEADAPAYDLYNVSAGRTFSALAFGQKLAERVPDFTCRLAAENEPANIDLHTALDRAPLSNKRIRQDLGYEPAFDLDRAVEDYADWLELPDFSDVRG
jgi:UDP-glucose 4-epimerase